MKNFTKAISIFSLNLLVILCLLDFGISKFIQTKSLYYGETEVWNDIVESKIDAEIAIYGSSRAWVHLNPAIFEEKLNKKTYNFGIDGHNFWLQYLRHKQYFKYNTKPKLIILSLDNFTLAKRKNLYNLKQFLPYMLWNNDFYEYTKSYEGFNLLDYYIPFMRYIGNFNLYELFNASSTKIRYNGFRGSDSEWDIDLSKIKAQKSNFETELDITSILLFNQFIKEIKEEDIDLIFVYSPEYIEGQVLVKNRNEIFSIYEEISNKHKIPFFNYSNDPISFDKSLFYNSQHLNKKGANKFTEEFIKDLQISFY